VQEGREEGEGSRLEVSKPDYHPYWHYDGIFCK